MILQKCPRCQRDVMIDDRGKADALQCDHCGHQWMQHRIARRIAGNLDKATPPRRGSHVDDVRAQANHVVNRTRPGKVDTPRPPDHAPHQEVRARRPTLRIKGYEILECRGKGGMGKVYRAVQKSLGREVAIKTLDSNLARNQASIWRFTKEAAAMAQLRHPNILYVIDRGKERNVHYFVMEYVDGPSLREMLRERQRFAPSDAVHIMLQLARTMSYAHGQGVVHRDLKPENILYNSDKCLKVADFGLAGVNRETTYIKQLTKSYVSMGTECYMAPEQRHDAKKVDQRADIYSMGVILYELIRGELPFPALPPPEQEIVEGRRDIDAIIRCCLHYDKEHRYQTTEDLVQALEHALEGGKNVQVLSRDTVVDTPALEPIASVQERVDAWTPEDFRESSSDDGFHVSWQPSSRKWLRGGLAFASLCGLVAMFFLVFAPRPRSSQNVPASEFWQRLAPEKQQIGQATTRVHFRFSGKPEKNLWGRLPEPQWRLFGSSWFAKDNQLHQDTYQRDFVRNRKQLWAVYSGKVASLRQFRFRAKVRFLEPWSSRAITQREYQTKHNPSRSVLMGLGWKGDAKQETKLMFQLKKQRLNFRLVVGRRPHRVLKCKSDYMLRDEWSQPHYKWGEWLQLELRKEGQQVAAWVNGHKRCQLDLPASSSNKIRPGLICQNAHCVFQQVQIDAFAQATKP
ncbi:MAG: serine/threonine protein kinase [Deltaproteobacteria bacterium]|nr:MAG: serine/threonine protein kinase [Deltaproteobacteria bacterium]